MAYHTRPVWVYREKINIDFLAQLFFPGLHTCVGTPKKNLGQKPNVKLFRVYTYLWGTFNLGFAKMTKFDTFGHKSPCRWGKKLIKPEYWCDDISSSCKFAAFCFLNFSSWLHFFLERLSVVMPPSSRTLPVILIEPWLALIKTIILYLSPRYRSWIRDTTADLFQNCNLTRITIHSERRSLYEKCGLQPS